MGSNPISIINSPILIKTLHSLMVKRTTHNGQVVGSNPTEGTKSIIYLYEIMNLILLFIFNKSMANFVLFLIVRSY